MLQVPATEIFYVYVDQVILYFVIPFYASIIMSLIYLWNFRTMLSVILILFR